VDRTFLTVGSIAGFLGVALGAFGAHALKGRIEPEMLAVYQTGVEYHLVHAVALLVVALRAAPPAPYAARMAGWLFTAGIVLFSFSLYALATTGIRALGAITPLGGVAFLGAWGALGWSARRRSGKNATLPLPT